MVPNEPDLQDPFRGDDRDRRLRHRICFLLDVGSLCLFALFLVHLLPLLVESQPLQAAWQGRVVELLGQQGALAFMGFILLHLAVLLNPRKQPLRHRLRLVRHLALMACLGYLLLIPLQLASSLDAFTAVNLERNQKGSQLTQLMEMRELIIKSKSNQDLSHQLKSLKQQGLSPAQETKDFADLQRDLISENDSRQALLAPKSNDSKQLSVLTLMISRVGSSLIWAVAFAAGAVPLGSRRTLLERLGRRQQDEA